MTTEKIIETIVKSIPYPAQITNIVIDGTTVRFDWRDQSFLVGEHLNVDTVKDGFLIGDDASILLKALLIKNIS